jgi:hypothetical protein
MEFRTPHSSMTARDVSRHGQPASSGEHDVGIRYSATQRPTEHFSNSLFCEHYSVLAHQLLGAASFLFRIAGPICFEEKCP